MISSVASAVPLHQVSTPLPTHGSERAQSADDASGLDGGDRSKTQVLGDDARDAYQYFLTAAMQIPPERVRVCTFDTSLVYQNAVQGVRRVLERQESIKARYTADWESIQETPVVALGLRFAAAKVNRKPVTISVQALVPELFATRRAMLQIAQGLAQMGLLPEREVRSIAGGRGTIDGASDLVLLAELFTKHEETLRGKHPFSSEQLAGAAQLGTSVLKLVRRDRVDRRGDEPSDSSTEANIRDRFWTLLLRHYEEVWKAGAVEFGRSVHEVVPALTRGRNRRKVSVVASPPPAS